MLRAREACDLEKYLFVIYLQSEKIANSIKDRPQIHRRSGKKIAEVIGNVSKSQKVQKPHTFL